MVVGCKMKGATMSDENERIQELEKRVERLERQMAALLKKNRAASAPGRTGDYRERYDSLDYPER